jgi:hypothetical protein
VAFALLGVFAGTSNGCSSSSSNNTANDASPDGPVIHHPEASTPTDDGGGMDGATLMWDGTTGQPCTTDTDCYAPGGPHQNKCSIDAYPMFGTVFPTPVCLSVVACDPCGGGACDGSVHQCDGPDQSAATPGWCVPTTNPAQTGMGICLPRCQYASDGSASTGCQGKDACNQFAFGQTSTGAIAGDGFCQGGCTADADCQGDKCDTLNGLCTKTVKAPTKTVGTPCTGADSTSGACNCLAAASTNAGYCSQFCKVPAPGAADICPSGFYCSALEPTTLINTQTDATIAGFATQNVGLAGYCVQSCTVEEAGAPGEGGAGEGGASDAAAGGSCPGAPAGSDAGPSTCQTGTFAGPAACFPF